MYETYCENCGEIGVEEDQKKKENRAISELKVKRKREDTEIREVVEDREEDVSRQKDYKVKYIGESWRSAYERGIEHQEDLSNLREKSHMLKHILDDHPGEKIENIKFGMRVKLRFKTALERQVSEAVEIHQAQLKGYQLMKSKSEYSRCSLPKLSIENQDELLDIRLSERNKEKKLKEQIRGMKKRK